MGKGQTERCQVQGQMIAIAAQLGFAVLFTRLEEVGYQQSLTMFPWP